MNMNIEYRSKYIEYYSKNDHDRGQNLIHFDMPPFPITNRIILKKWSKLLKLDVFMKSIGTCLLSIFSIVVVIFSIQSNNKEYLLFAILPSCVQLFNEIISWYQIDDPVLDKPIVPKRILARLEEFNM